MTIKILLTIVTRGLLQEVTQVLQHHDLEVQFATLGHGTASSEIRHMLGIGTTEKDVVITLAPQQKLRRVLPDLSSHLHLAKAGHGIAFAIELDSINAVVVAVSMAAEHCVGHRADNTQSGNVVVQEGVDGNTALGSDDGEAGMSVPGDLHRCHAPEN